LSEDKAFEMAQSAYGHVSLIDLYLQIKFRSNRKTSCYGWVDIRSTV